MNAADEAKLLAECSAGPDGRIDPKRVAAACEVACRGGSAARKLAVLRKYERLVQRKTRAASVTVESSAELSDAAFERLKKFVESQTGREDLTFARRVDPSLIGGVRIICGDIIWERSAKLSLESIM